MALDCPSLVVERGEVVIETSNVVVSFEVVTWETPEVAAPEVREELVISPDVISDAVTGICIFS